MLFINLRGLLPNLLKTYIKGWVDTIKDQSCIPVPHQFKFASHKINISQFKNDVIGHLT